MNVKRIVARTSREAMRQLKEVLGPDAVILSNRAVEGGVEVLAMPAEAIASLAPAPAAMPAPTSPMPAAHTDASMRAANGIGLVSAGATQASPAPAASTPGAPTGMPDAAGIERLFAELAALRTHLETRIEEMAWRDLPQRDPRGAALMRELLSAGFSAQLARTFRDALPPEVKDMGLWVRDALSQRLDVLEHENEVLDRGGVFALMGPTGAGKTTTTAKLAARFVVRHGAEKLALLTTDSYRIGGHEQLRIYGKILGVAVHAVRDTADLKLALTELRNKHVVLIDTVGMSQRDQAVAEQIEMLAQAGQGIRRLLMLNATSHGETLSEVVEAYRRRGLDGCVLTKIDEAASLGPALDCAIRHRLKVHYLATGQRVPEDLHLPNRSYLAHRALKARAQSAPWRIEGDELADALMAGAGLAESGVPHA